MGNLHGTVNTEGLDGIGDTPDEAITRLKAKIPEGHYAFDHETTLKYWETSDGFYETNLIVKNESGLWQRAEINHLQGTRSDYYRAWFGLSPKWGQHPPHNKINYPTHVMNNSTQQPPQHYTYIRSYSSPSPQRYNNRFIDTQCEKRERFDNIYQFIHNNYNTNNR